MIRYFRVSCIDIIKRHCTWVVTLGQSQVIPTLTMVNKKLCANYGIKSNLIRINQDLFLLFFWVIPLAAINFKVVPTDTLGFVIYFYRDRINGVYIFINSLGETTMKVKVYGGHKSTYTILNWVDESTNTFTVYSRVHSFNSRADAERFINSKNPAPRLKPEPEPDNKPRPSGGMRM